VKLQAIIVHISGSIEMKILVTGSRGQLGSEIKALSSDYPALDFVYPSSSKLDICDMTSLSDFIKEKGFEAIINCAAYTAVDQAEKDVARAGLVNAKGVGNLVVITQRLNLKLIHISTDYVFDGTANLPYSEKMPVSPLSIYGKTKRAGELEIIHSTSNSIVIRSSWMYSSFGNNFVKTMLRLGKERESLGVIYDQVGTPTYARDLAQICLEILSKSDRLNAKGKLYHFSNEGVASWYDFAKAIMEMGEVDCQINPIETKDYRTAARRPPYSVLNKAKIKKDFGIEIPYWRDSLKECIQKIKETEA